MNKKFIYISSIALVLGQISCNDYLKEDSGDLLIPKTVEEFAPLLYGEGYPSSFENDVEWHKLMTDDVEMGYLERGPESDDSDEFDVMAGKEGKQAYTWDVNIEDKILDENWDNRYKNILGCNTIIDALPDMEYPEKEVGKYYYLASQAYALRAYHYFCLINCYALPYSQENLNKLGVIIREHPQIQTDPRERSTIGQVYELINDDIKKAQEYASKCVPSVNMHLMTPAAVQLLATRIALFQEKWDEVISVGKVFLRENNFILDLTTISKDLLGSLNTQSADKTKIYLTMFNLAQNKEIVFTFGGKGSMYPYGYISYSSLWGFGFRVSYTDEGSLIKSYEPDDARLLAYFAKDEIEYDNDGAIEDATYNYYYPIKFKSGSIVTSKFENWRTVEVLLNVAEAYARKSDGISQEAIDLLNQLRARRIYGYTAKVAGDFSAKDDLVKFIWAERRRELCFEESMRFWDLRRQGMPRIEHKFYTTKTSYETYVLEKGSKNYVLALPQSEMNNNHLVTSNEREVISRK